MMSTIDQQLPSQMKEDTVYVCERSIFSSFNVFTDLTKMSNQEAFMIKTIYDGYKKTNMSDGIIFINSSPKISLNRAISRGHPSDNQLTLEKIEYIHQRYQTWLEQSDLPVYYIDQSDVPKLSPKNIIESAIRFFEGEKNK